MTAAVFLAAGAVLAFEIALLRILSTLHWHHQVQLVISGALLGFGAGGTALAVLRGAWHARAERLLAIMPALAALTMAVSYRFALAIPFNALELAWHPGQLWRLAALHLTLAAPFFMASIYLALVLEVRPERRHALYAMNLAGSGTGALAGLGATSLLAPERVVIPAIALAALSAVVAATTSRVSGRVRTGATTAAALALVIGAGPGASRALQPSPYKSETQQLLVPETRIVASRAGTLARWRAIAGPSAHYAPGLSLAWREELPEQVVLFADGEAAGGVTVTGVNAGGATALPGFLGHLPTALAHEIRPARRVFIAGLGGGLGILESLRGGATEIVVAEPDRAARAIVSQDLAAFSGHLLEHPAVRVAPGDARAVLACSDRPFDLVRLAYLEGMVTAGGGAFSSRANYALTTESLALAISNLSPRGVLALGDAITLPPREGLRSFATLTAALSAATVAGDSSGMAERILMLRGWNSTLILASRTPWSPEEVERARRFADERGFDWVTRPGMSPDEGERFHQLQEPVFRRAALALLGSGRESFLREYPFDVSPTTDDRPFASHTFRWQSLGGILRMMGRDFIPYVEGGYILLAGGLVEGAIVAALCLLVPVLLGARRRGFTAGASRDGSEPWRQWRLTAYFALIGAGFMLLELGVLMKLDLFIGDPLVSAGVTIAAFLVLAGIGSYASRALAADSRRLLAMAVAVLAVALLLPLTVDHLVRSGVVAGVGSSGAIAIRMVMATLLLVPLALPLGVFFPGGLALASSAHRELLPWAWAVNGFASVIGSLAGAMLPMSIGLAATIAIGGCAYVVAALILSRAFRGRPARAA